MARSKTNTANVLEAQLQMAEQCFFAEDYESASEMYMRLTDTSLASFAYYKLAQISNNTGDPVTARSLYYKTLDLQPDICKYILSENHPNHDYIYKGKDNDIALESCPLCGKSGEPYWCYFLLEVNSAHVQIYNPVRTWIYCEDCHHLYAEEFPAQEVIKAEPNTAHKTEPGLFSFYSEMLTRLGNIAQGNELLEIGVGGGECALAALEMGYNVFGLDISEGNVLQAQKYGIDAQVHDVMYFETDKKWDIIIMGDVIEHVGDPVACIEKVKGLLNENGVLWLSTPNFDGSFSRFAGHTDPMRREGSHKNYFSNFSLFKLLERFNFVPVDYRISKHYNGSMEVISIAQHV